MHHLRLLTYIVVIFRSLVEEEIIHILLRYLPILLNVNHFVSVSFLVYGLSFLFSLSLLSLILLFLSTCRRTYPQPPSFPAGSPLHPRRLSTSNGRREIYRKLLLTAFRCVHYAKHKNMQFQFIRRNIVSYNHVLLFGCSGYVKRQVMCGLSPR